MMRKRIKGRKGMTSVIKTESSHLKSKIMKRKREVMRGRTSKMKWRGGHHLSLTRIS